MDDLLQEFLIETNESLDVVDVELVRFEQEPNNAEILGNIFRLVHTIKGTCGFLGLPRLEALAHAAETLMSKFRDGMPVTGDAVTLVLFTIDRIKDILGELEKHQREPEGTDTDLIGQLEQMVQRVVAGAAAPNRPRRNRPGTPSARSCRRRWSGRCGPGEVSLDELERVFRETPGPVPNAEPQSKAEAESSTEKSNAEKPDRMPRPTRTTPKPRSPASRSASASTRSNT